jgi:hypothetical protein
MYLALERAPAGIQLGAIERMTPRQSEKREVVVGDLHRRFS